MVQLTNGLVGLDIGLCWTGDKDIIETIDGPVYSLIYPSMGIEELNEDLC